MKKRKLPELSFPNYIFSIITLFTASKVALSTLKIDYFMRVTQVIRDWNLLVKELVQWREFAISQDVHI